MEDRTLRKACQNALVISVMVLENANHKRVTKTIVELQRLLDDYHTTQNRALRSAADSAEWLEKQINGGIVDHQVSFMRVLSDPSVLMALGFCMNNPKLIAMAKDVNFSLYMLEEDDQADLVGTMTLSHVGQRTQ